MLVVYIWNFVRTCMGCKNGDHFSIYNGVGTSTVELIRPYKWLMHTIILNARFCALCATKNVGVKSIVYKQYILEKNCCFPTFNYVPMIIRLLVVNVIVICFWIISLPLNLDARLKSIHLSSWIGFKETKQAGLGLDKQSSPQILPKTDTNSVIVRNNNGDDDANWLFNLPQSKL